MSNPLISIITVNLNNNEGLIRTIKSVLCQSFRNYEHIIIDGMSTDGSRETIEQNQQYFSYWISEKDAGVYEGMNKGIQKANGKYLFFLNSGDCFASADVLEKVSKKTAEDKIDFIYGNIILNNKLVKYRPVLTLYYLLNMSICHQAQFISKRLFNLAGLYNTDYKITADRSHLIKCFIQHNVRYCYINEAISVIEPKGKSTISFKNNLEEKKRFIKNEFPLLEEDYERLKFYNRFNIFKRGKTFMKRVFKT